MKKSSESTKNILSEVNHILGIQDSYQAPERVLALVTGDDKRQRDEVYYELAELFGSDYSRDWFWEYFQEEHADRRQNKQDFTPPCIASVIHNVLHDRFSKDCGNDGITYDPAAGTGQLVIRDWWLSRKGQMPWEYKPMDHLVVCAELSVKTIPFLLLNLSIRGICGMVFHANSMTNEIYQAYVLTNEKNDPLCYSDVTIEDKTILNSRNYLEYEGSNHNGGLSA